MAKPESAAPASIGVPATDVRLDRAPIGEPAIVVRLAVGDTDGRVHAALADQLAFEGVVAGALLVPERRLPLGGPIVVSLGRARVALGRDVARQLIVRAVATDGSVSPDAGAPA